VFTNLPDTKYEPGLGEFLLVDPDVLAAGMVEGSDAVPGPAKR
jgi:hypothetical protein